VTDYAELARYIVGNIVGDPDAATIDVRTGSRSTVVRIKVSPDHMGKLIGKNGRNIDALRAVMRAAGLRHRQRVQVDVT
jgi:predicted RNA-binding protein YlqC (UPF0109 family)